MHSSSTVALIVGMGVSTWVAVLAVVGYFARGFLRQQNSNHRDTLAGLDQLRQIKSALPRIEWRLTRLEAVACVAAIIAAGLAYRRR